MPSIQQFINPMPLGRAIVDKDGVPSKEFWWFLNQLLQGTQGSQFIVSAQTDFPVLDQSNANTFIYVPDFAHIIFWDGDTPQFADGGNDYYAIGQRSTASPGWHLVDGSTVPYLKADGTLGSKTLLNAAAAKTYLAGFSGIDALNAAVAPTLTTPANTGNAATGVTIPANTGDDPGGQTVQLGIGATVPDHPHQHPMGVITDPGHHHSIAAVTAGVDGQPRNFTSRLWFRQ